MNVILNIHRYNVYSSVFLQRHKESQITVEICPRDESQPPARVDCIRTFGRSNGQGPGSEKLNNEGLRGESHLRGSLAGSREITAAGHGEGGDSTVGTTHPDVRQDLDKSCGLGDGGESEEESIPQGSGTHTELSATVESGGRIGGARGRAYLT